MTGFAEGTGSLTVNGQLRVGGGDAGAGGNGTVNMNTSGTLTVTDQFHVGTNTSTGVFNLDKGAVSAGNTVFIGNGQTGGSGVNGTLNMSGGTFTKTGNNNFVIGDAAATGNVVITGGALVNNNEFQLGNGINSHGNVTLSGGSIDTGSYVSIGRTGGTGVMNISGGTFTKTNAGAAFIVGDGSTGTLNQTGGTITAAGEFWVGSNTSNGNYNLSGGTLNNSSWFVVGRNANSVGTLTMTNGAINLNGTGSDFVIGADGANASGTVNFSGGIISGATRNTSIGKNAGNGVFTMSGNAEFITAKVSLGESGGKGIMNFNGGTLRTGSVNGLTGISTFNFNGGTLQATGNSATFISGLTTANLQAGGALIDTQAFSVTASQAFSGTGNLVKSGSGTLTLTGTSSYTGTTNVTAGKLVVDGNISTSLAVNVGSGATIAGSGITSNLVVAAGGIIAPGTNNIGVLTSAGSLALSGNSVFEISTGNLSDLAVASTLLSFGGTLNVTNIGGSLVGGDTFNLFDWGTATGTFASVSLPALDAGLSWDQSQLYTNGQISVIPEPGSSLLGSIGMTALLFRRRAQNRV